MNKEVNAKLEEELKKAATAKVIADYLKCKCESDELLATGILDKGKTLLGCMEFVKGKAKERAKSGFCMVEDTLVFKWVEQFYGKEKPKITQDDLKAADASVKNGATVKFSDIQKKEKKTKEMEGQLDLFGMMM